LWHDADEFLAATVPFVSDGVAAGEAVMVGMTPAREEWLRDALGQTARDVHFVDITELGRNPARIMPAWQQFFNERSVNGGRVRGLGEPIWSGRRPEEIAESQLHEALLNVAVKPDTPCWLMCPYDAGQLDPSVIEEVYRSHPAVVDGQQYRGSHLYGGRDHVDRVFGSELPELAGPYDELTFDRAGLQSVPSFVATKAYAAGAGADRAADLAVAAQELATSSLQRGAAQGLVRVWAREDAVVFEVRDSSPISDPLTGRRPSTKDQRKGTWVANQLCDLVQLRSSPTGTTVRVHHWL